MIVIPKKICLPFEDYSGRLRKSWSKRFNCNLYEYVDCSNNNIILEGSFNRLYTYLTDKDFAIVTAYNNVFTKAENILRNRELRSVLDKNKMGPYCLVGHWLENTNPDADYENTNKEDLIDRTERSYLVVRPSDMDIEKFKEIIVSCLTINGKTQDCGVIHRNGVGYFFLFPDGHEKLMGTKITLNKVAQMYSQYVRKLDLPFIIEGIESPSSNAGRIMFSENNLKYI